MQLSTHLRTIPLLAQVWAVFTLFTPLVLRICNVHFQFTPSFVTGSLSLFDSSAPWNCPALQEINYLSIGCRVCLCHVGPPSFDAAWVVCNVRIDHKTKQFILILRQCHTSHHFISTSKTCSLLNCLLCWQDGSKKQLWTSVKHLCFWRQALGHEIHRHFIADLTAWKAAVKSYEI